MKKRKRVTREQEKAVARHALPDHVHEAGFPFMLLHSCVPPPQPQYTLLTDPCQHYCWYYLQCHGQVQGWLSLEFSVFMVLRNFLPGESLTGVSSNHKLVFHKLVSPRGCLIRIWVHFTGFLPSGCVVLGRHFTFPGPGSLSGEKSLPFDSEGTSGSYILWSPISSVGYDYKAGPKCPAFPLFL